MLKFSENSRNMPIFSRFSRFLAKLCQFRQAETNKQFTASPSVSTRYELGVLKFLHDMKRGC